MAHPPPGYEQIDGQIEQAGRAGFTPLVCLSCGCLVAPDLTAEHDDVIHKVKP